MCILFILERYFIVLLWKYVFWPAQMVGVLYIYIQWRNFKCVLRHMEDQFICTRYQEIFFKKQLSNLKVKI